MEFIVTEVERSVDGLEGLKVDIDPPLLSFRSDDLTTVHDQTIGWNFGVELEALLGRGDGRENRQSVNSRLDVRGRSLNSMSAGALHR